MGAGEGGSGECGGSARGRGGISALGVSMSSLWKPLACEAAPLSGPSDGLFLPTGVVGSSVSELPPAVLGVAAPLSLETHSSSSPSDGLDILKSTFCRPSFGGRAAVKGAGARRSCAGWICSREGMRWLLAVLENGAAVRVAGWKYTLVQRSEKRGFYQAKADANAKKQSPHGAPCAVCRAA